MKISRLNVYNDVSKDTKRMKNESDVKYEVN